MSKKQKRRRRNKRHSQQRAAPATLAKLIEKGDFEGAIAQLKAHIEKNPRDDLRKKLTYCYVKLAKYQEAIATLYSLDDRLANDLGLIGWCFIQLEDWEQAVEKLDEALEVEEFAEGYYWLAVARAKGRKQYYELEEEDGASIQELLRIATRLPRCRLDAFLWLEELYRRGPNEDEKRAEILKEAVEGHAESVEARSRLANLLIFRLEDPEQALNTISPLLDEDQPEAIALGYAFYTSKKLGNLEKAFEYLDAIEPHSERPKVDLVLIKGDTLVSLGRISEALSYYDEAVEEGDLEQRIVGLFGKARVAIKDGDAQRAVHDARQAADLWFEALIDDESFSPGNLYVLLGDEPFDYRDSFLSVEEVSQKLLDEDYQGKLDDELRGRLIYLRYKYWEHVGHADEDKMESLLVRAHELLEHPLVSRDLSFYYLEPDKISKGVHHHLSYALWKHSTYDSSTPFPAYLAELDFLDWEEKPIVNANDRASVHQAVLSHLETSGEEAVKAVMVPFYESFWRRLLFEGEMFEEVLELTGALLESAPDKALLLLSRLRSKQDQQKRRG